MADRMTPQRRAQLYAAGILREADYRPWWLADPWCVCGAQAGFELVHHEPQVYIADACRRCGSIRYESAACQVFYRKAQEIAERDLPAEVLFFQRRVRLFWISRRLGLGEKFSHEAVDLEWIHAYWTEHRVLLERHGCALPDWARAAA